MKHITIGACSLFAAILTACATTGTDIANQSVSPSKPRSGDTENDRVFHFDFETLDEFHPYSGLVCPSKLNEMSFEKSVEFSEDGEDVGCSWQRGAGNKYVTVYATHYPTTAFKDLWAETKNIVNMTERPRGLSYDGKMSTACTLGALTGVAAKTNKGEVKEIGAPFTFETAVFKSADMTSIVTLHPAADGWMIKVRSSYPLNGGKTADDVYISMCMEAAEITQVQSANITKAGW